MSEILHAFVDIILNLVGELGYIGIFLLMTLESSFVPFPSEVVLIPAGYHVANGDMSMTMVLLAGVGGSLAGALINYYISLFLGRKFIISYGKYFFFSEEKLTKLEAAFAKHGSFATFVGRLIFGIRQWISIPAGLAKMNLAKFVSLTSLGAALWVIVLVALGYVLGESEKANEYAKLIGLWLVGFVVLMSAAYIYWKMPRKGGMGRGNLTC